MIYYSGLTTLGLTRQTIDRAEDESSSLLLSRQSERDGERFGGHVSSGLSGLRSSCFSEVEDISDGGVHGTWPRHHETSAGATPTTIANPKRTIVKSLVLFLRVLHTHEDINLSLH